MPPADSTPPWVTDQATAVLVLSPHLDDAIFSAWALISTRPTHVWTVFAGSPEPAVSTDWDRSCGFSSSDETLAARRREDLAAFADTDATVRHLTALDGPYTTPERRVSDMAMLRRELTDWWLANPEGVVVVPAGAGAQVAPAVWERFLPATRSATPTASGLHDEPAGITRPAGPATTASQPPGLRRMVVSLTRTARAGVQRLMHADYLRRRRAAQKRGLAANNDHLAVRDLALAVAAEQQRIVALYEDLPYLWAQPADDAIRRLAPTWASSAFTLDIATDTKFAHCAAYPSQVLLMDPVHQRLARPGHLPTTERYWTLSRQGAPT